MEQARLFIAIGISFLVFFVWSFFFAPKAPEAPDQASKDGTEQRAPATPQQPQAPPQATAPATPAVPGPTTATPPAPVPQPAQTYRSITVDTPMYRMTLSEKGGAVTGIVVGVLRLKYPA